MLKASRNDRNITLKVANGFHVVAIKTGQMIFGRFTAAEELGIDGNTIYKIVQRMAERGDISIQSNNRFSMITVTNFIDFQDGDQIEDIEIIDEVTAKKQQSNTKVTTRKQQKSSKVTQLKNVENVKKVKNVENDPAGAVCPDGVSNEFKIFWDWIDANAPRVHRMKEPFSEKQFLDLKKSWDSKMIADFLKQMHNWEPLVRKNRSAYLTIDNWLNKRLKNESNHTAIAGGNGKLGTSAARTEALRKF